jgi:hypothetical protein
MWRLVLTRSRCVVLGLALSVCGPLSTAWAQRAAADSQVPRKQPNPRLFRSEEPLTVTLSLNLRQIKRDKSADSPWRDATIRYADANGKLVEVPLRVRTRGVWRLNHCDFPPLRLRFGDKTADGTLFANLERPKLVTYCRNADNYESYVLQEAQLYRILRVLTDASFKVRVLRIAYADSASGKVETTRYSFIIEDPDHLAERLGGKIFDRQGATSGDLMPGPTALMHTYLYFIANTDIDVRTLHNVEIITLPDGQNVPVPYDFDMSGVINAAYAGVDPKLPIKSVRIRLFRGFCAHEPAYATAFDLFRERRAAIEALYTDAVGQLLSPATVRSTLKYFGEFYEDIATPESVRKRLFADCVK